MDFWTIISGIFVIIFLFFVVVTLIMYIIKNKLVYLKNVPGPRPWLFFGNYFDFVGGTSVILKTLTRYLDKYGDTLLAHDGTFSWVIITIDYEFIQFILSSSTHIDKAGQYTYLHKWLGQGLLTSSGSKWRSHRKAITPAFHFSILQGYVGVFDNVGDVLVQKLQKEVGKDSVEISEIISLCALDIICEAAMGVKMNSLNYESEYIKNIKAACLITTERMFTIVTNFLYPLTWKHNKEKRIIKEIHNYVDNVISKRIEKRQRDNNNGNVGGKKDNNGVKEHLAFLDLLLNSKINGRSLTREELRDEVNTFMFEGHDTTSSAITFCLLMIATHPEVQDKVVKEQQSIFENDFKTSRPTYQQLNEMKYLELVIKETLRLFPSVPYFARKLAKDIEFKGSLYPKGMPITILPFIFQRSSKYFPEPEKFMPERFERQNEKRPYSYTPFSAGPRNCIGQKFAMLEMLSIISKLIRNFELGPSTPEHKLQLAPELILISKNGVRISIKNRI